MDALDNRESSLKELPTRELKLKRHRVRRDSPTIPPVRLRLKSNNSSLNSEVDIEKGLSDRSVSSSPENINQEHSPIFVSTSYKKSSQVNSSPSSPLANDLSYDLKENAHYTSPTNFTEQEEYDQPLDMSRKRTQEVALTESKSMQQQQLRPSVITCASALLRTQCSLSDLAHQMCSANVSDCNSNDIDKHCLKNHQNNEVDNNEAENSRPRHRREVVSGSCDPVIDEHFRRSLGKDYQHIFSKSANNSVSITVDDHFAKALGDTWHQIQQSKSVSVDPVSPAHSSQSLQPQQPPSFLHQPPEIF